MSRRGRGEGTIAQRSDGLWVGRVSLGQRGGKRQRKAVYGKTRREAAERLTAVLRARQQGLPIATERMSTGAYLESWLTQIAASVRPVTALRYKQLVHKHLVPPLGKIQLTKLMPADLSSAYAAIVASGLAPRTALHAHRVVAKALRDAEAAGLIGRNVARLVRPPRVPTTEMSVLNATEVRRFLGIAADDRLACLYELAIATAARQGELLGLKWTDLDWDGGAIRIQRSLQRGEGGYFLAEPKTKASRRSIPIGAAALASLRRHRAQQHQERLEAGSQWIDGGLIFCTVTGTPLDGRDLLRSSFRPLLRRASVPTIRFHDLRHTAATLLLGAGTHPKVVAERLGHSTPAVTLTVYSHVTPTMQKEATATLDAILSA